MSVYGADSPKMDKETIRSTLCMNHLSVGGQAGLQGGEGQPKSAYGHAPLYYQPRIFGF